MSFTDQLAAKKAALQAATGGAPPVQTGIQTTVNQQPVEQQQQENKAPEGSLTQTFSGADQPVNAGLVLDSVDVPPNRPEAFSEFSGETAPEGSYVAGSMRRLILRSGVAVFPVDGLYTPQTEWEKKELAYFAAKDMGYVMSAETYNKSRVAAQPSAE